MPTRRTAFMILALALLACARTPPAGARGARHPQEQTQPPPTTFTAEVGRGVELYRHSEYEEAAKAFKKAANQKKDDTDAWRFLGLTYVKLGKPKDARKSFERAVSLSFQKLIPKPVPGEDYEKLSDAEKRARRVKLASNLNRAADAVEDYLTIQPPGADFWRAQLESLRFHAEQTAKPADQASVFFQQDVDKKAELFSRPEPLYTEEARAHKVSGEIAIRFVLRADGTVQHFLVVEFLPDGLTGKAVAAARSIKLTRQ